MEFKILTIKLCVIFVSLLLIYYLIHSYLENRIKKKLLPLKDIKGISEIITEVFNLSSFGLFYDTKTYTCYYFRAFDKTLVINPKNIIEVHKDKESVKSNDNTTTTIHTLTVTSHNNSGILIKRRSEKFIVKWKNHFDQIKDKKKNNTTNVNGDNNIIINGDGNDID